MKKVLNIILFILPLFIPFVMPRQAKGYPVALKEGEVPPPLVLPYQKCGENTLKRTQNWIENLDWPPAETEAEFCFECQQDGQASFSAQGIAEQIQTTADSVSLPKECFLAMSVRGNRTFKKNQYVICPEGAKRDFHRGRKLCVTPEYVETFREVFLQMSKCFSHSRKRQQQILHLINRESGGIANILSPSTAKCFGQITEGYVDTINNQIRTKYSSSMNPSTRHLRDIYDAVIEKCPNLREKKLKGNNTLVCGATRDPYACLFYSFLGLDRNMRLIKDNFDRVTDHMGNSDFDTPEKEKIRGVFPLTVSEIARVKILLNGEEREWLIWDDSELYHNIKSVRGNGGSIDLLSVDKIPLFEHRQDVELFFNYWAHNGGGAEAQSRLIMRLERLKERLSHSSCQPNDKTPICKARLDLLQGKSLSNRAAVSFFEEDLRNTYKPGDERRRNEVADYVGNIIEGSQTTFDYTPDSEGTNNMIKHYKGAFQYGHINLSDENADNFQKHIANVCPDMADIISWPEPE